MWYVIVGLNDQSGEGAIIRVTGQDLHCDEITMHLDAGKTAVALELEWDGTLSFVLKEDLSLKQIKPTDSFATQMNEENSENPLVRLDTDLVLISSNFKRLVPQIFSAFGGLVKICDKAA
jgi:recombination associated protein RdgC